MKRTKPLPARAKPIARGAPPKRRTAVRRGPGRRARFPKNVDKAYRAWIREQPCILADRPAHRCEGVIECCHYRTRGSGAPDVGNCYSACSKVHRHQHLIGVHSFQRYYGIDLETWCARLGQEWGAA